jgi:hypothetical protein
MELTKEEEKAISALKRVEKIWPESLWLFSGSGTLWVMKTKPGDGHVHLKGGGGIDPQYIVTSIDISNDGGDWDGT